MKPLFLTATLLFALNIVYAQNETPVFGSVSKEDLDFKMVDFDKDAEAVVLFDYGKFVSSDSSIDAIKERHVRIKILKPRGLGRANIHISFQSFNNNETVSNVSAQTYNLDAGGNIVISKLDSSLLYRKEINRRFSELVFTLPEVRVGSVIEYKYSISGAGSMRWYFQRSIPVKLSRFVISFPETYEIRMVPHTILPLKIDTVKKENRDILKFTMENVPSLSDEPFMLSEEDYLQRLDARVVSYNPFGAAVRSYVRTWEDVVGTLMSDDDFGVQLKKNVPRTGELDDMLKQMTDPYKKMVTIHDYVRNKMEWNGYDNIWALKGVKSAWKEKKGTTGEINLILVNLLKDADLDAHPLLVSTKSNGRINRNTASSTQFDKVMAYIELNGKKYVLDATEKITPSRLIPLDVMATDGLVIEKPETNQWGWKTLWDEHEIYNNAVLIKADIDKEGKMSGEATVTSADYARVKRMPLLNRSRKDFIASYFDDQNTEVKIDSVVLENEATDSLPLIQHVFFREQTGSSGDYNYFTANMFSGLEKNPFVADTRFSDIFFGYKQHITIIGNFTLPDGYQFEELPKNVKMIMPDTGIVFTRIAAASENQLSVKIILDLKKPIYSLEEYPEFREFNKKMFTLLNEQFVFRKKN